MDRDTCVNNLPSSPRKRSEKFLDRMMKIVDQQIAKMSQQEYKAAKEKIRQIADRVSRHLASF